MLSELWDVNSRESGNAIAPDQIIALLIKSPVIRVSGFTAPTANIPFFLPEIALPESVKTPRVMPKSAKYRRLIRPVAIGALTAMGGFIVSSWLFMAGMQPLHPFSSGGAKTAKIVFRSISPNAVHLTIGEQVVAIRIGSALPSGEVLQAVDVQKQSFSTDSQSIFIKK